LHKASFRGTVPRVNYEEIRIDDDDDHVRLVTLDRPARRNAMSWRMLAELGDAMAAADTDDDVRVVVITGAPPAFCAGTDMTADGHAWQHQPTGRTCVVSFSRTKCASP
jgi:enoyl-CoA hydratase/carnithine racemase